MNALDIDKLQNYIEWIDCSPTHILKSVKAQGGWAKVFPSNQTFPEWASKIRNYFNVEPVRLKRLSDHDGARLAKKVQTFRVAPGARKLGTLGGLDKKELIAQLGALSGDVYVDNKGRFWYQMGAGGAIYHYKGTLSPGTLKAIKASTLGQEHVPIFKLISPDGTGGSCELCVHNWQLGGSPFDMLGTLQGVRRGRGKNTIGDVGQWVNIRGKVVNHEIYRGSYNYSETIKRGLGAHTFRDITPHKDSWGFYINPPMFSTLETRLMKIPG